MRVAFFAGLCVTGVLVAAYNLYWTHMAPTWRRAGVFRAAVKKQRYSAAYVHDGKVLVTYTHRDGFHLRSTRADAYPFPAWRFQKVEFPAARPARVAMDFGAVVEKYRTTGVCFDVGGDIGIEWRADGWMRVWCGGAAYDSYAIRDVEIV